MAKFFRRRSTSTALAPRVVVVRSPGRARRLARRAAPHIARHGRRIGRGAVKALPTTSIALAGLVVGYIQAKGYLDKLPQIGGSKVFTLGIAGYLATRFVKNPHVRTAGVAALAAAAVDFGRVQGGGTSGIEEVDGDGGGGSGSGQGY
jgi:hypothetical protein